MVRFCRYQLRTTNVGAARAFYSGLVAGSAAEIVPLPAAVQARGAPAHWLGHLGVEDVERAVGAFVKCGATRLGPTRATADGGEIAIVRDPGAAVVALATAHPAAPRVDVAWHLLNTTDLVLASRSYSDLFGWQLTDRLDLGSLGVHQQFAWQAGAASAGSFVDIAGRPGVHPHWLFYFSVPALDAALVSVRAAGGRVMGPTVLPGGETMVVCEDPQGAAFSLREARPA